MPTIRETGKDRWKRVPKDYFKKPDGLQRTRLRLSLLALVASIGWVASGHDWTGLGRSPTDGNSLRANHGKLARVHVAWEGRCEICHVPFEPIAGRALLGSTLAPAGRSSDKLCQSCHAGPSHHAAAIPGEIKACAECHRDHRGRDFSLLRLEDNECSRCHQALAQHTDRDAKPRNSRVYAAQVETFDAAHHPAFRSEFADYAKPEAPTDRGKLKFNHARHMTPGIVNKAGDRPYTVGDIPVASERPRHGKSPADPVRLDCASCHLLDADSQATTAPSRGPGDYYRPVNYQNQCRACHPLTFDPKTPELEAPHGVQPGEVSTFLHRTYAAQILSDNPKVLDEFRPRAPLPGKARSDPAIRKRLDEAVASAEAFVFGATKNNCAECHEYGGQEETGKVPARIEPTRMPAIWYTHASFDHTAHRAVSCRDCHARAYAFEADGKTPVRSASRSQSDVLIPSIDNCVRCHAPTRDEAGWFSRSAGAGGAASTRCTECHRYHNGDRPSEGAGAMARGPIAERTIAEFLGGLPRSKTPSKSGTP